MVLPARPSCSSSFSWRLIAGLYIVAYTSNVFLTIIQQTAGGIDTITWTKEPWNDWIGKTLHLALIVACWLVPLGIVLRLIGPESLAASTALYVGVPALVFCLLFPITLLSSFSGGSPLGSAAGSCLAHGPLSGRDLRLLSAVRAVVLAGAAAVYVTLAHGIYYVLPALATVLHFLPPAFSDFHVESGGVGAGTVTRFKVTAGGRTREYRMRVDEPEPGRVLTESDTGSSLVTTTTVSPRDGASLVQISTAWDGAGGIGGVFERMFAPRVMQAIYADGLERLNVYARGQRLEQ